VEGGADRGRVGHGVDHPASARWTGCGGEAQPRAGYGLLTRRRGREVQVEVRAVIAPGVDRLASSSTSTTPWPSSWKSPRTWPLPVPPGRGVGMHAEAAALVAALHASRARRTKARPAAACSAGPAAGRIPCPGRGEIAPPLLALVAAMSPAAAPVPRPDDVSMTWRNWGQEPLLLLLATQPTSPTTRPGLAALERGQLAQPQVADRLVAHGAGVEQDQVGTSSVAWAAALEAGPGEHPGQGAGSRGRSSGDSQALKALSLPAPALPAAAFLVRSTGAGAVGLRAWWRRWLTHAGTATSSSEQELLDLLGGGQLERLVHDPHRLLAWSMARTIS